MAGNVNDPAMPGNLLLDKPFAFDAVGLVVEVYYFL